jgi:hypothetical protein
MSNIAPHSDPDTLLRLIDDDLPPEESFAIANHLLGCRDCRDRLDSVRDALDDYGRFHHEILKTALPGPPRGWKPLRFPQSRRRTWRPGLWMMAAAAAVAAIVLVVSRIGNPGEVRASELLLKAAAAEKSAPPSKHHVRIRSRGRTVNWPPRPEDSAALQAVFQSTGYPWRNPLSATAYQQWRDTLPHRRDEVQVKPAALVLHTFTPAGVLSDAELTLRAADLHAIECTLHFRSGGDVIEMIEVEEQPEAAPTITPRAEPPAARAPVLATIADELHVVGALHNIGADLGEAVEVDRTGSHVQVRVSGLDQPRRDEIRAALASVPFAELHFEDAATSAPAANPQVGNTSDALMEATEHAVGRAFALRSLARRFTLDTESHLSDEDAATLKALLHDHATALAAAIHEIQHVLSLDLPESVVPSESRADWRSVAENIPSLTDQLDHALNTTGGAIDARKAQIARILAQLDRQASVLRNLP